jgi:hypothetical protein
MLEFHILAFPQQYLFHPIFILKYQLYLKNLFFLFNYLFYNYRELKFDLNILKQFFIYDY